ncbi:uncharacterized protein K02A2.6-like [Topomyia yanbarensis]|uniref:uncharacterized protein K02A2.6-like n=1 Tax=Topomyia yanbarensis TaxID=2498891 RepID=UPI00273B2957|nr:uncharacterized protein K02A2.6-like [Topomyia yanbarensis]
MKEAGVQVINMFEQTDRILKAYAASDPLKVLGMFTADIQAGPRKAEAKFYVVEGDQQCLLGDKTACQLQVLKIGFDIAAVKGPSNEFPKMKGILVEIPIDKTVQPVQQPYRRAPFALEGLKEQKLSMLLDQDIIESVNQPAQWVSPLVPVLKDSGEIRLCIDMRRANRAVVREKHPLPVIEELLGSINGAVKFSKLDIKDAYHQVELSEHSREITTFITKYGLFRYKRLMFGICSAPELFQKVMETVVAGLDGVLVYLDDLVVFGRSQKEHDNRLEALLKRHELSVNGIMPTESRVRAIQQFRPPTSGAELRSFLGLVTYVGRFIPNLASKTDSLRSLLRSSTGLGAVLLQENNRCEKRIIAFASKALTDLERKYFQTEREALALVWGVEKFRLYLMGTTFKLITDCKPLHFLFSCRSKPCPRIERWVLRDQSYQFDVIYEPGATNLADALSRLSLSQPKPFDDEGEFYIRYLTEGTILQAITLKEIEEYAARDSTFMELFAVLDGGSWSEAIKGYKPFELELIRSGDLLLRGDRLVVPCALRKQILNLAHESHPEIVSMKRRLRQKVWWPGIDRDVEQTVKGCKSCTIVSALDPPEPLKRTQMPERPWIDLAADFVGPLPSGHNLLVIVDYFTRFIEVIVMKQITAPLTVKAFHETFCRFGFPETLKTDNGPQFISGKLKRFCDQYGIQLRKTTPYWPQANGEVERINGMIKKHLRISQEEQTDWKWDLRMCILMYNSTPHSTTGVAPSVLMFGRIFKDKLPSLPLISRKTVEEARDRDKEQKYKGAEYADHRRKARPSNMQIGDKVVVRRMIKDNKLSTNFSSEEWVIIDRNGANFVTNVYLFLLSNNSLVQRQQTEDSESLPEQTQILLIDRVNCA